MLSSLISKQMAWVKRKSQEHVQPCLRDFQQLLNMPVVNKTSALACFFGKAVESCCVVKAGRKSKTNETFNCCLTSVSSATALDL